MGIRGEDITASQLLRQWSDEGTLLDLFTQTEAIQVRVTDYVVIERGGAQYIAYELELVETSDTPGGPTPVVVVDLLVGGIRIRLGPATVELGSDVTRSLAMGGASVELGDGIIEELAMGGASVELGDGLLTEESMTVAVELEVTS